MYGKSWQENLKVQSDSDWRLFPLSIFKHFPTVSMLTIWKKKKNFLVGSFPFHLHSERSFKMHLSNGNNDKKSNKSAADRLCHSTPELGVSLLPWQEGAGSPSRQRPVEKVTAAPWCAATEDHGCCVTCQVPAHRGLQDGALRAPSGSNPTALFLPVSVTLGKRPQLSEPQLLHW